MDASDAVLNRERRIFIIPQFINNQLPQREGSRSGSFYSQASKVDKEVADGWTGVVACRMGRECEESFVGRA